MRTLCIVTLLLLLLKAPTQNIVTDTSTTIYTNFKKGEKKIFRVKETSTQYVHGFVAMKASNLYETTMEVQDDSADHFKVEWTIKTVSAEDKKFAVYSLIAHIRNGLKVRYKINRQGVPMEILNPQEVTMHLRQAFDSLAYDRDYDAANRALVNQLPTFLQTPGGIIDVYLKPLFLYHVPYGSACVLNKPTYRAVSAPNAYGGENIPTVVITELNKLKRTESYAQLTIDQIVNKELAAKILAEKLREITEDMTGKNVKNSDMPEQIKMKDHNEFDVILSSGWLSRAFFERITKDGGARKVDQMEISLQ